MWAINQPLKRTVDRRERERDGKSVGGPRHHLSDCLKAHPRALKKRPAGNISQCRKPGGAAALANSVVANHPCQVCFVTSHQMHTQKASYGLFSRVNNLQFFSSIKYMFSFTIKCNDARCGSSFSWEAAASSVCKLGHSAFACACWRLVWGTVVIHFWSVL